MCILKDGGSLYPGISLLTERRQTVSTVRHLPKGDPVTTDGHKDGQKQHSLSYSCVVDCFYASRLPEEASTDVRTKCTAQGNNFTVEGNRRSRQLCVLLEPKSDRTPRPTK